MSNIIRADDFKNRKRYIQRQEILREKERKIPNKYKYDIQNYRDYCKVTNQEEGEASLLDYLYVSLVYEKIKKTTWERRLAAIKKHLLISFNIDLSNKTEANNEISVMRKLYNDEEYKELTHVKGKSAVNKDDLLELIRSLPVRAKAICLVNLVTANRPNEMISLKIKDFNLDQNYLSVYLKKQKVWKNKRITQEVVTAVKTYIRFYNLKPDDYFVGRVYKNDRYKSVQVSESGYRYMLNKWIGLTAYNLRKTQVAAMHQKGADLPTIAKQTGHKSLEVLSKHYLDVSDSTIDKYL